MSPRRLLVVGRHAEETAETTALLELVRELAAGGDDLGVHVLLQRGGPLIERFAALAPTVVVGDLGSGSPMGVAERALGRVGLVGPALAVRARRLGLSDWGRGDVVYLHTVLCVQVLRYLGASEVAVLCRVPEAAHPLHQPLSAPDLALLVRRVDRFLPVTAAGVDELCDEHGVDATRVVRIPEAITSPPAADHDGRSAHEGLRRRLGLPEESVVVGSFGASALDPPSPAAALAVALRRHHSPARMLCVAPEHLADGWAQHDVECADLGDRVTVVEATDPLPAYPEVCDVVVHAGWGLDHPRPYLDAMALGVPVVCFDLHEMADLVGADEAGYVCPYLDLDAMAECVAALVADSSARRTKGAVAAQRVQAANGAVVAVAALREEIAAVRS